MLLLPPSIDEADESWLQRFSYWEKKCGLTEEEKAKHLIDVLGNNSKLIHSLQDKFFDKFTIEQIMGRAVLERVKGFWKILAGHDINKALNRWNEFGKCITTPEMVEAFINRFNAGLEKRIVKSKLDLDTSRKDTLYKQTEAALREALSAGPGPGESAEPAAHVDDNEEGTEKSMSSKSSLGTGPDINDSVWEHYNEKAWKEWLEKKRYQERKNKLENNLRELEKLQQDVQELSSKAQQWKQEWKMIKAEGLMKEQQEVMSQQVVLPSHQTSDQLDVNGGPSDTQGFLKGLDELPADFDEQRHDASTPM